MLNNSVTKFTNMEILKHMDDGQIEKLTPSLVFLCSTLLVGIPGNLIVLLIYRQTYRESVYRTLIWSLAWTDILFCMTGTPFNISRIIRFFTFTERWACQLFTLIFVFLVMVSSSLLIVLSIHRYRQICIPFGRQITLKNIKYFVLGCIVMGLYFSIQDVMLQPTIELKLSPNLTAFHCPVNSSNTTYGSVHDYLLVAYFIGCLFTLVILYSLIARKLYLQRKKKELYIGMNKSVQESKDLSVKMTKITFTISVIFAVSYIPIIAIKAFGKHLDWTSLTQSESLTIELFSRTYVLNHVTNPFIYAFFDHKFRRHVIDTLSCRKFSKDDSKEIKIESKGGASTSVDTNTNNTSV